MKNILTIIIGISMAAVTTFAAISHEDETITPEPTQVGNHDYLNSSELNSSEAFDFDSEA